MNDPIPEPLSGKHVLDWAVPVTRALNAIGDKIGAPARNERDRRGSASSLPWSFACTIDEGGEGEEETRTGGWTNCRLQLGLDLDWHSPDLDPDHSPPDPNSPGYDSEQVDDWYKRNHVIKGCDTTDDGTHYIWIVLADGSEGRELDSVEIKTNGGDVTDLLSGKIRIGLGTVADGKIGLTPHLNPCVYKYL